MRTDDAAAAFARKVYGYLERMRPGRACTFARYGMPQLEWCIRTTAAFILEGVHWKEYTLSDDCLTVRRDGATDVPERLGARRARSSNFKIPHPGMHVGLNTTFGKNH